MDDLLTHHFSGVTDSAQITHNEKRNHLQSHRVKPRFSVGAVALTVIRLGLLSMWWCVHGAHARAHTLAGS